ncbi:MAG: hypothetical protein AAF687_05250 [Pseudomonadota bacterium]
MRGFVKPPFANYDVVVYFGGGLFLVPFIYRYILEPLEMRPPNFSVPMGQEFLTSAVSTLTTLFVVYVIGHMLAYISSQFIEKFVDRVFGKVSTAIFVSAKTSASMRDTFIRAVIYDRLSKIRSDKAISATVIRFLFHVPALPIYLAIFSLGMFGYYDTRIPHSTIQAASRKLRANPNINELIRLRTKWYKPLEYYVINRCPDAVHRMYNYLVISGLFRTLSLIFLVAMWAQAYFMLYYAVGGDWLVKPLMGTTGASYLMGLVEFSLLSCAYTFSLFSYLKFQRRYAEEAIFAFVFEMDVLP